MLDLAHQLELEGHDALVYIQDADQKDVGEGVLRQPVLDSWGKYCRSVDLIITAGVGLGQAAESLKKKGFVVVGGTSATDRLTLDPAFAMQMAVSLKLKVPRWKEFKLWQLKDAVKYAQKHPGLVFRPTHNNAPNWLPYMTKDRDQMIEFLECIGDSTPPGLGDSFILQELIEGSRMSVGGWFNGYQFCRPVFEHWKYRDARGEAVVGKYADRSKLFRMVLNGFSPFFRANKYAGYCDVTCIVRDRTPHFVGINTGFQPPALQLLLGLHREDVGNFLYRLAKGETKLVRAMSRWGCGLGVNAIGRDIPVFLPDDLKYIHFGRVKKGKDTFSTAGTSGLVVCPIGHARTLKVAIERAYETLRQVQIPSMTYREDLLLYLDCIPGAEQLKKWGFLK